LNNTLDHPVILATAKNAILYTGCAKIKITIITGAAMEVLVWDRLAAVIAENRENASCA